MSDIMASSLGASGVRLCIRPLVIPRRFFEGRLYFYIVFTFARVQDDNSPVRSDGNSLPLQALPPCMTQNLWPSWLFGQLDRKECEFGISPKDGSAGPMLWKNIRLESPLGNDPTVEHPRTQEWGIVVGEDGHWERVPAKDWKPYADQLWQNIVLDSLPPLHKQVAQQVTQKVDYWRKQNLGDLYWNQAQGGPAAIANPNQASDLRPGLRVESLDSRSLAHGLQQARARINAAPTSTAGAAAPRALKKCQASSSSEIPGLAILKCLFSDPEQKGNLEEFIAYLLAKDVASTELANFIVDLYHDRTRAKNGGDLKFKELFDQQLTAIWNDKNKKPNVWTSVADAFQQFLIYQGQTEVRRHGRFVDSAAHRLVIDRNHAQEARAPVFRTASYRKEDPPNGDAPYIDFEGIMAQIQLHPGLTRRMGLSVLCSVDWSQPDSGKPLPFPPSGMLQAHAWVRIQTMDQGPRNCFIEPPTPTMSDLQFNTLFRARPQCPRAFLTPPPPSEAGGGASDCSKDSTTLDVWRRYHVLPTDYYLVTQDDYSLIAGRSDMSIVQGAAPGSSTGQDVATDQGRFHRQEVNTVNFYFKPQDSKGQPITVAEWLHDHMKTSAGRANAARKAMAAAAQQRKAKILLVSDTGNGPPEPTPFRNDFLGQLKAGDGHEVYAEQLMQGYTIDVCRPRKDAAWRSLCHRQCTVDLMPGGVLRPGKATRTWYFGEEGFMATTALVAPRPYVGPVTCYEGVDANTMSLQMDVMDTHNTTKFNCHGKVTGPAPQGSTGNTPQSGNLPTPTRVSWIVHPTIDWQNDIKEGDVVLATPSGPPSENTTKDITVTDLVVHPVFNINVLKGKLLKDLGEILLVVASNDARQGEQFPIMLAAHGTRYLDTEGVAIEATSTTPADPNAISLQAPKLPDNFEYFTVEGEPRYYSAPWSGDQAIVEVKPITVTTEADFPSVNGIFNSLGPVNALTPKHLASTDTCQLWTTPNSEAAGPADTPNASHPYGSVSDPEHYASVTNPDLTIVRGQVSSVTLELLVQVQKPKGSGRTITVNKEPWEIVGGPLPPISVQTPPREAVPTSPFQLDVSATASLPATEPDQMVLHIIAGVERGDTSIECRARQCDVVSVGTTNPLAPQLTWTLSVNDLSGNTFSVQYAETDVCGGNSQSSSSTSGPAPAPQDRYIHPAACAGWYVEVIGVRGSTALTGRGRPQNLLGTLVNNPAPATDAAIYFTDGTKLTVTPPAGASTPLTKFFQVYDDASAGSTSPTATPCTVETSDSVIVAGELYDHPALLSVPHWYSVRIRDLDGNTWDVRWPDNLNVRPTFSGLPQRLVTDLELGEFLIVHGDVNPTATNAADWTRSIVAQKAKLSPVDNSARAAVCLVGTIPTAQIPPLTGIEALSEGSTSWDQIDMASLQKHQIPLWYQRSQVASLQAISSSSTVVSASMRVIFAETVTQYVTPTPAPNETDDQTKARVPIHATISEAIARWNGWSLVAPVSGNTDPANGDFHAPQNARFAIRSERPDLEFANAAARDFWQIPTLRFTQQYWFCLRRVDLAGNLYYDDPLPVQFDPQTEAEAKSTFTTWLDDKPRKDVEQPNDFERADDPGSPVLAFARGKTKPSYVTNGKDVYQPVPPRCDVIAYKRPRTLLLLSDAFGELASSTLDAQAFLLPPPCPEETVLLQGKLDQRDYREAGEIIREHDREEHLIERPGSNHLVWDKPLLGLYPDGDLNYFGDVDARDVTIEIESSDTEPNDWPPADPKAANPTKKTVTEAVELMCPKRWPCAKRVALQLRGFHLKQPLPRGADLPSLTPCDKQPITIKTGLNVPIFPSQTDTVITLHLPPGTVGSAVINLQRPNSTDRAAPKWRTIQLIHATNAPMIKPSWDSLTAVVLSDGSAQKSNYRLNIAFHMDRPSSGSYQALSYWNEYWDEKVDKQHQPAEFVLLSECHKVKKVHCVTPGFGYGATAVVQFCDAKFVRPPLISVAPRGGVVDADCITIHDSGEGCPAEFQMRVLRRPPLTRIAQATVHISKCSITAVTVCDGGGYYLSPPLVVAIDPTRDGSGAKLHAVLDAFGSVREVIVREGGARYSDETVIRFYTDNYKFPEQAIKTVESLVQQQSPGKDFDFGSISDSANQSFQGAKSRQVDYLIQVNSRFRDYLTPSDSTAPPPQGPVGWHVPRYSDVRALVLSSQTVPNKPDVAYMMHSFQWKVRDCPDCSAAEARSYFLKHRRGRVAVRREASVRIYMFRPWNITGIEQLGVVVFPAILNTVRVPPEAGETDPLIVNLNKCDRGAFNPLRGNLENTKYDGDRIEWYVIPAALRDFVSRIGFDPVWSEHAFAPLTIDQFKARRPELVNEDSSTGDASSSSQPGAAPPVHSLAWIAAHQVHFDSAKEMWYADIRIDYSEQPGYGKQSAPDRAVPFVQLALVTYQPQGLPGKKVSPIYQCDMIKLLGDREAELRRDEHRKFTVTLRGQFDYHCRPKLLPLRQVFVKLQSRNQQMPEEVVVYQPAHSGASSGSGVGAACHADVLEEFMLLYDERHNVYTGQIELDPLALERRDKDAILSLAIEEYEVYAAAEGQLDRTGDSLVMIDGRKCARQLVFSFTFDIESSAQ
jgi:hypothetical protein